MQLAIDARTACQASRRGIGKCLVEIYRRLPTMKPDWRFIMFHRGMSGEDPFAGLSNVENRKIEMRGDRWGLWEQIRLPWAAKSLRSNFLHCPANTGPRWPRMPMVLTIHDLIPMRSEFSSSGSRSWASRVATAARTARIITTPSEYSRSQIVEAFGIDPEKISVHPWGPNPNCHPIHDPTELNRVRLAYGMKEDQPYLIAFGGEDPRKNTQRIVRAWNQLADDLRHEFRLLVIGVQDPFRTTLQQELSKAPMSDHCILQGYVPEMDMAYLLTGASLLLFPSLCEGFGLPILDAFASETAILTSYVTSIPEIAGDAAYYVDPRSEQELSRGIELLLRSPDSRNALVEKGRQRLLHYSWQRCAELFLQAVETAT